MSVRSRVAVAGTGRAPACRFPSPGGTESGGRVLADLVVPSPRPRVSYWRKRCGPSGQGAGLGETSWSLRCRRLHSQAEWLVSLEAAAAGWQSSVSVRPGAEVRERLLSGATVCQSS